MSAEDQLPERLPAVLGAALGLDTTDVTIDNLRPLTSTFDRATWAFDAVTPYGRRALILHATSPTHMRAGMGVQARARAAAAARGVPVARIVAADDSADALGDPFLISEMAPGETDYVDVVGQLDSADGQTGRARLLRQCALALAAIHRVSYDPQGARQDRLGICRRALDALGDASATFEWAFRWLDAHRPPPSPAVLVHGDYRMGNLLVEGSDLTSVLDWDWVHIGEAYEDLACFCVRAWRYGAPASLGAGGLGSIEDFLCAYEQASGTSVDRAGFHWWRVLSTLSWGITCRDTAQKWLALKVPSPQLAITGRRVCEAEWDLLNLLDGAQPGDDAGRARPEEKPGNQTQPGDDAGRVTEQASTPPPAGGVPAPQGVTPNRFRVTGQSDPTETTALYGRPTAAELVAVVAKFLDTIVGPTVQREAQAGVTATAEALRTVERELLDDAVRARRGGTSTAPGSTGQVVTEAARLFSAIAEFFEINVERAFSGNRKVQAEVTAAANALRIVERELVTGSADEVRQVLAGLGSAEEAQLAAAIRNGDLDQRASDVTSCLRTLVNRRLAVAHPGYRRE